MHLSQTRPVVSASFDDPNLVSAAGLDTESVFIESGPFRDTTNAWSAPTDLAEAATSPRPGRSSNRTCRGVLGQPLAYVSAVLLSNSKATAVSSPTTQASWPGSTR